MFQISLKAARVNANMTQKGAGKAVGVDAATIINWEKGNTFPKAHQLKALCEAYDVPIDRIILSNNSTISKLNSPADTLCT